MKKALQYLKRQILVPGLRIKNVKFQTVVFQLLPLESIIVNGLF